MSFPESVLRALRSAGSYLLGYYFLGFAGSVAWNLLIPMIAPGALEQGVVMLVTDFRQFITAGSAALLVGSMIEFILKRILKEVLR